MAVVSSIQAGANIEVIKDTMAQPYIGVVPLINNSGNVANAAAVATLSATATSCVYLCGIVITGAGATAASTVNVTVTGTLAPRNPFFNYSFVAGPTVANQPLMVTFDPPIPANAINVPIVVTVPAGGAGNLNSSVLAWGFASTVPTTPVII
jgi:hypothetical protein